VLRPRLVETGPHDRRIKIVRHDNVPHAAQKPDRPDVRADPVGEARQPAEADVMETARCAAIPTSPQLANIRLGKSGRLAVTNQFLG
jgi:hypothetical protein